jgi:hypothetical protein
LVLVKGPGLNFLLNPDNLKKSFFDPSPPQAKPAYYDMASGLTVLFFQMVLEICFTAREV